MIKSIIDAVMSPLRVDYAKAYEDQARYEKFLNGYKPQPVQSGGCGPIFGEYKPTRSYSSTDDFKDAAPKTPGPNLSGGCGPIFGEYKPFKY